MRSEQSQITNGRSQNSPSPLAIWAAMFAVYIVWGSTYLAIRFAVETLPPFLMASARFLVAGIVLYTWRRMRGYLDDAAITFHIASCGLCPVIPSACRRRCRRIIGSG